jgi:hypothetical protein
MPRAAKKTFVDIDDVTCDLGHPSIVGVRCDAGNVDRAGANVDEEEHIISDQPLDGMVQLAKETGLTREGLYKALSKDGNPSLGTVLKVLKALGLKFTPQVV